MGTMQDQLNAHKEALQAAAAGGKQVINGDEVLEDEAVQPVLSISTLVEVDEDRVAELIQRRIAKRQEFVETRNARDIGLQQRRDRLVKNEANLRTLYQEKPEVGKLLQEEMRKLTEARKAGLTHDIPILQAGVQALTQDLTDITGMITALEARYPELKAKLDEERRTVAALQRFLERFAKEVGEDGALRYTAHGTPNPGTADIKTVVTFLEASIKEASQFLIVLTDSTTRSLFVSSDGKRWAPKYPHIPQGIEVCSELAGYAEAIRAVKQKKLQQLADEDMQAGLLLTSQEVARQKKDPHNRYNIVNLVRYGDGFCFIPNASKKSTTLTGYSGVPSEIKVECASNSEETKRNVLKVTAVTMPSCVEDFFFPEEGKGKLIKPVFYFNDLHEISTWRRIHPDVRESLVRAVRWAEGKERETAVMEELGDVGNVDDLRTIHQLADGAVGMAVVHILRSRYTNDGPIGFQMVSDGVMVRPGSRATEKSKKLPVYEEILDGKPVAEFFTRTKEGLFANAELQEIAVRNEFFELKWLVPVAAAEHHADLVDADNIRAMIMPNNNGGVNGTYVFQTSVTERHRGKEEATIYHEVAYVVRHMDNTLTFVSGLTRYSTGRLTQQGFAFDRPYDLGDLKGYLLHVLQRAYCKILDVDNDELPEHLKVGRAKAQN